MLAWAGLGAYAVAGALLLALRSWQSLPKFPGQYEFKREAAGALLGDPERTELERLHHDPELVRRHRLVLERLRLSTFRDRSRF